MQATMASVSFYEEMGFIRVGAVARYLRGNCAREQSRRGVSAVRGSNPRRCDAMHVKPSDAHPSSSSSTVATATGQPPTSRSSSSLATRVLHDGACCRTCKRTSTATSTDRRAPRCRSASSTRGPQCPRQERPRRRPPTKQVSGERIFGASGGYVRQRRRRRGRPAAAAPRG